METTCRALKVWYPKMLWIYNDHSEAFYLSYWRDADRIVVFFQINGSRLRIKVRALVKNGSLIIKQQCFTMKLIRAVASWVAGGIFKNYLIYILHKRGGQPRNYATNSLHYKTLKARVINSKEHCHSVSILAVQTFWLLQTSTVFWYVMMKKKSLGYKL